MAGKWDCHICKKDCEGNGHGTWETRICCECQADLAKRLWALLLAPSNLFWEESGVLLEWPEIEWLLDHGDTKESERRLATVTEIVLTRREQRRREDIRHPDTLVLSPLVKIPEYE